MGRIAFSDDERLRAHVEKPYTRQFWGSDCTVEPKLISEILGKGDALLGIHPILHRPNYYVVRVPSTWFKGDGICDHLEEIYEAIECEYPEEEIEHKEEDGAISTYCEWPYVGISQGSCWFRYYLYGRPRKRWENERGQSHPSQPTEES